MREPGINSVDASISGVLSCEIPEVWSQAAAKIQKALDRAGALFSAEYIRTALLDKKMQLWLVRDGDYVLAVAVTQVEVCDADKALHVVALGGELMHQWLGSLERVLRIFAAAHGCRYLSLQGRRGWVKKLQKLAWRESAVIMYKEL